MPLSTKWLLVITGCISTGASLAGGLIMYFEALNLLEETVEETGRADMQSIVMETGEWFNVTHATLMRYKDLVERLPWEGKPQFDEWLKQSIVSDVYRDKRVASVGLRGFHAVTREIFFAGSWYDIERATMEKMYVYARQKPSSNQIDCSDNCAEAISVDPSTGTFGDNAYDFALKVRNDTVFDDHPPGTFIWRKQVIWYSDVLYPYNYVPYIMVLTMPGHPIFDNYNMILAVDMHTDQWADVFDDYKTEAHMVITEVNDGGRSKVLSGNFPSTRVNVSNADLEPVKIDELGEPFVGLVMYLNNTGLRVFCTHDGHWAMHDIIHKGMPQDELSDVHLMWFRPVSTINSRLNRALWMLLGFAISVFVFDCSLIFLEVLLIAQPLNTLSHAVLHMTEMNLEQAQAVLATSSCLHIVEVLNLHHGLSFALMSLTEYRTFLPQAILTMGGKNPSDPLGTSKVGDLEDAPQGEGGCFIVFTDVQSSTAAWEVMSSAMRQAMRAHNDIMRETIEEFGGYEVKTIGDAFMIAFERGIDACNFGLTIQVRLVEVEWPEEIYQYECYAQDETGAWGGLRVRVGVHYGPVNRELNLVAQRYDYLGTNVNKAARVEAVCIPGAVAVTKEVLDSLMNPLAGAPQLGQLVGSAVVVPLGPKELKGVSGSSIITLLVPSLGNRLHDIEKAARRTAFSEVGQAKGGVKFDQRSESSASNHSQMSKSGGSSTGTSFVASNGVYPVKLRERLERVSDVTVGWVNLSYKNDISEVNDPLSVVGDDLEKIVSVVERTDAALQSFLGTSVIVTWNITRACLSHMSSSIHFVSLLYMSRTTTREIFTGICHGHALTGNVGTAGMRFSTVLGSAVTLAGYLATSASDFSVPGLFTSLGARALTGVKTFIRPVDEWEVVGSSAKYLIFEIRMQNAEENVLDLIISDLDSYTACVPWGWTDGYTKSFHASDVSTIMSHSTEDPFLKVVATMLEQGKHMRHPVRL